MLGFDFTFEAAEHCRNVPLKIFMEDEDDEYVCVFFMFKFTDLYSEKKKQKKNMNINSLVQNQIW